MKNYNIGILGATGVVGREMMKILSERGFPAGEIRLFASEKSAGKKLSFGGETITVEAATKNCFSGLDIVFGAVSSDMAKTFAPHITASGAVFIDNSSAFRQNPDVPLVVPEINPSDALSHNGIIANPNCSTIITLVAVNALCRISPIKYMIASTYQAVSGAGAGGITELYDQQRSLLSGDPTFCRVFPHRIAENLIPQIGTFLPDGYTTEEMKMQNEGRKILHLPDLRVTCTCVRVPVVRSHSISVSVFTEDEISIEEAKNAISDSAGCVLADDTTNGIYPMPIDSSDKDSVLVGRVRRDDTFPCGISLFCCGDQIRKGAATNAVQIAELLVQQ